MMYFPLIFPCTCYTYKYGLVGSVIYTLSYSSCCAHKSHFAVCMFHFAALQEFCSKLNMTFLMFMCTVSLLSCRHTYFHVRTCFSLMQADVIYCNTLQLCGLLLCLIRCCVINCYTSLAIKGVNCTWPMQRL